jgi:hypothetical protein
LHGAAIPVHISKEKLILNERNQDQIEYNWSISKTRLKMK